MNQRVKGTICGILAAVCYGTNPLGALSLKQEGVNTTTILAHRFSLAAIWLIIYMLFRKESLRVSRREFGVLATLGILFSLSSLSLFYSFNYMDAGVASTMLFVYPVMVALIMMLFFKEKPSFKTLISIALALCGIWLLYQGDGHATLDAFGVLLVMVSSLTYAVYIVIQDRKQLGLSPVKTTVYVTFFCLLGIVIQSFTSPDAHLSLLPTGHAWFYAIFLSIVPTVLALSFLSVACRNIGSTPTAIMGALEPLTAVLIGICIFGEAFTLRLAIGIALILAAVVLIVLARSKKTNADT